MPVRPFTAVRPSVALVVALMLAVGLAVTPAQAVGGGGDGATREVDLTDVQAADVDAVTQMPRGDVQDLGRGDEERVYLIRLADPAVPSYQGGKPGLAATAPQGGEQLDSDAQAVREYQAHLEAAQVDFVDRMDRAARRDVEVPYRYTYAVNGMAAILTPDEARRVALDPDVVSIRLDQERELQTDQGPRWMGADAVWGEDPVTGAEPCEGYCGEGMIIGTIDTGISPANPSFADVGADGYDHTNPLGAGNYLGVCDPDNAEQYDPDFICNDKLIGAYGFLDPGAPGNALDYDGHGSHTASTSGGNVLTGVEVETPSGLVTPPANISGVAPHANIIAYTGCCSLSGLTASIDQAIADGVDVINYSIGSNSASALWDDFDTVGFLNARAAGISVVTSNGNSGPGLTTTGSPADAPWITSVGASTHTRHNLNSLIGMTSSNGTLPDIAGKSTAAGLAASPIVHANDFGNPLCLPGGWPDGTPDLSGMIAICDRGTNGRVEKSQVVADAGAAGFVLINDPANDNSLLGDEYVIPGVFISNTDGAALKAWLDNGATDHTAGIAGTTFEFGEQYADIMASFSSRGPNQAIDVIVPDVTAPGVDILAALGAGGADPGNPDYEDVVHGFISGTSMSSPHVAGATALIRQAHPTWTPAQVQSALMTTARSTVTVHTGRLATPFEQGAGHVQVDQAVLAGLLFDESIADYNAANPADGGDGKTLNLPSFSDSQCLLACGWSRTAAVPTDGAVPNDVTWTPSVTTDEGLALDVTLTPATVSPGDSMTIDVAADVSAATEGSTQFGRITLTPSDASIPEVTMPVAVVPSTGVLPAEIAVETRRDAGSWLVTDLQSLEITDFTAAVSGLAKADLTTLNLTPDPTNGDPYDNIGDGTVEVIWVDVPAGSRQLLAEVFESVPQDLDMFVGFDADGEADVDASEEVAFSASGTALESVTIDDPAPGSWWVLIQHWDGDDGAATVGTTVVPAADLGNAHAEGPATNPAIEPFDIRLFWDLPDTEPGDRWFGILDIGTSPSTPTNIGSIPVSVERVADDVTKTADVDTAEPGDTVTYTLQVEANVTPEDLEYTILDTIPEGMTYVPDSLDGPDMSFDDVSYSGGQIRWTPTLPTRFGVEGTYTITTSDTDPSCDTPVGGYRDLRAAHGFFPIDGLEGDTTVFTAGSSGAPFTYLGDPYAGVGFTDDGFLVFDAGTNWGGAPWIAQDVPDPALPNNVLAMLWDDYTIVEDPANDDAGVTLVSYGGDGPSSLYLVDFRHLVPWFDPDTGGTPDFTQGTTMQAWVWRSAGPGPEITVAFDELNTLGNDVTAGWENAAGTNGDALYNAEPAAGLTTDTVICYDYTGPSADPITITYQVTVDDGVADTNLTNLADHVTDNPGDRQATAADTVTVGSPPPTTVTVAQTASPATATTPGEFTFTRDDPAFDVTVAYTVSGTAVPGTDYSELPGVVTFEPGALTATVPVTVLTPTNGRTVTVTLDEGPGHLVGEPSSATVTLFAPTSPGGTPGGVPVVDVAAADDQFVFTHSGGSGSAALSVAYTVGGTAEAGTDYEALSGTVTIPAGTDIATVDVTYLEGATEGATITATVVDGDAYNVGSSPTATLVVPEGTGGPVDPGGDGTTVLAGETRIQTAIAISRDAFPEDDSAAAVVLARADVAFDALAATPLAVRRGGPLLLTQADSLHPDTLAEVDRVLPEGGTVYLMGGTAAQSEEVEAALTAAGYVVERLFGPTRYETALAVAEEIGSVSTVLVASGEVFADALSAGAAAGANDGLVVLTPNGVAHPAVQTYLDGLDDADVYGIGGPAATAFPDATPLVGSGREATSVLVAETFFDAPTRIGLARSDEFADALAGGVHSALSGGPVTLTPSTLLHPSVQEYVCATGSLAQGYVYGGDAAVAPGVVTALDGALSGEACPA